MTKFSIVETVGLCQLLHANQFDKAGEPYWKHPMRVMFRLGENKVLDEAHAALLHDVMEDCNVVASDLAFMGFSARVIGIVSLLTHPEGLSYYDYVERIIDSNDVLAMRVKLADLYDNSDLTRLDDAPEAVRIACRRKYERSYLPAIYELESALGTDAEDVIQGPFDIEFTVEG